jgi:hypothetical protein
MSQLDSSDPLSLFTFDLSPDLRIPELPGFGYTDNSYAETSYDDCAKKNSKFVVPSSQKVKKPSSYTKVIHDLAENPKTNTFISWTRDGKFLYVRDSSMLCAELERGKYFRSSKFASIVRNLNYHCFRKLRFDELDSDLRQELDSEYFLEGSRHLFYHPYFQRGRPDLLEMIKSQKTDSDKKNEEKKAIIEQTNAAKVSSDTLDLRLEFARKEAELVNIITQRDVVIAEKDAEIAALRALLENSNTKRKFEHYECSSDVSKKHHMMETEEVDYDSIFDDFSRAGYLGEEDDMPSLI